ncbi:hypothetical protein VR010_08545 [Actinomycetaceae bacterium L2_0104]
MIVAILVVVFILAAAAAVYVGVFYSRQNNVSEWVSQSVDAWRADELDTDDFEVQFQNGQVGDLFDSFPQDPKAYYTPEDVEQTWEQMVMLERDAAEHVKEAAAPVIAKVTSAAGKLPTKRRRSADSAASAPEAETEADAPYRMDGATGPFPLDTQKLAS